MHMISIPQLLCGQHFQPYLHSFWKTHRYTHPWKGSVEDCREGEREEGEGGEGGEGGKWGGRGDEKRNIIFYLRSQIYLNNL